MTDEAEATPLGLLARAVRRRPDGPALEFFDRTVTWAQLDRWSEGVAGHLVAVGVRPGDRVLVQLQNVPQAHVAVLGAWKAGAAVVLANPMYRAAELARAVADTEPAAVVFARSRWPDVREAAGHLAPEALLATDEAGMATEVDPRVRSDAPAPPTADLLEAAEGPPIGERPAVGSADLAVLCSTSGTSGLPKAAMIDHGNLMAAARGWLAWSGLPDGTRLFASAPICHISGFGLGVLLPLATAGTAVLPFRFLPDLVAEQVRRSAAAVITGPATAYAALLARPDLDPADLASLRLVTTGGSALPMRVLDGVAERLGLLLHPGYGLTETTGACTGIPLGTRPAVDPESGVISSGAPFDGVRVVAVGPDGRELPEGEVGELVVSGRCVPRGYWRRPEETAAVFTPDGVRTGDVGRLLGGEVFVLDRTKEMINASGLKVSPREVEEALLAHPDVVDAGVTGVPDDYRGETVVACVVLAPGTALDEAAVRAFLRDRLAAFKVPTRVVAVAELPRSTGGKVQRRLLPALLAPAS